MYYYISIIFGDLISLGVVGVKKETSLTSRQLLAGVGTGGKMGGRGVGQGSCCVNTLVGCGRGTSLTGQQLVVNFAYTSLCFSTGNGGMHNMGKRMHMIYGKTVASKFSSVW